MARELSLTALILCAVTILPVTATEPTPQQPPTILCSPTNTAFRIEEGTFVRVRCEAVSDQLEEHDLYPQVNGVSLKPQKEFPKHGIIDVIKKSMQSCQHTCDSESCKCRTLVMYLSRALSSTAELKVCGLTSTGPEACSDALNITVSAVPMNTPGPTTSPTECVCTQPTSVVAPVRQDNCTDTTDTVAIHAVCIVIPVSSAAVMIITAILVTLYCMLKKHKPKTSSVKQPVSSQRTHNDSIRSTTEMIPDNHRDNGREETDV